MTEITRVKPYYQDDAVTIYHGDCLDVLGLLGDDSVDAVVTDPPYGLRFMGKKWDHEVPSEAVWRECLRVLKPGGHLLAFAGTRTQHRMAVRIEDAGFEIRDMIAWVYGSGFPKSLNVSKAIDKAAGAEGARGEYISKDHAIKRKPGNERMHEGYQRPWRNDPEIEDRNAREYLPATEAARKWQGWGTALKPAMEMITMARKPLIGTVAANVLAHGTGAINVDVCRVGTASQTFPRRRNAKIFTTGSGGQDVPEQTAARWPSNFIHDGSDEVVRLFPVTHGHGSKRHPGSNKGLFDWGTADRPQAGGDSGSAARFFYCAKASKKDRDGSTHPTIKPVDLMRYLVRLVTPPGGTVLDPFMGSGSTGKACIREGFRCIGIERESEFCEIAARRMAREMLDLDAANSRSDGAGEAPPRED